MTNGGVSAVCLRQRWEGVPRGSDQQGLLHGPQVLSYVLVVLSRIDTQFTDALYGEWCAVEISAAFPSRKVCPLPIEVIKLRIYGDFHLVSLFF